MENLSLKLTSNNQVVLEGNSKFRMLNNKYIFRINNSNYSLNVDEKVLVKKDIDTTITIDINKKSMFVELTNHPGKLDIELIDSSFDFNDNKITIKYTFDLEGITTNIIEIILY